MAKKKRKPQYQVAASARRNVAADGTGIKELGDTNFLGRPLTATVINEMKAADGPKPDDSLPYAAARKILAAANDLKIDPNFELPNIPDDEVRRLITENPEIALEGVTRLGKVMVVPQVDDGAPPFDPLEIKARVVGDMRKGFIDDAKEERAIDLTEGMPRFNRVTALHINQAIQIDCQAVYERWMAANKGNDLYELRMAPPWPNALLVYNNEAGNVWAMHMIASDLYGEEWTDEYREEIRWQPQPPADHSIDWDRVRWVASVQVYCGGRASTGAWVQTVGPLMVWRIAVYEDGEPADMHWTHVVPSIKMHKFNNALGVLTETLNMCNCINVEVAYPTRPMARPQRRRFDRMGVRFSEVHVRPTSKSYRGKSVALADMEMPLHGVRGHYATYGKDGKGLLFGKLAGRFWIPPHMRGTADAGTVEQSYSLD
jgi:hypothetical protein